MMCMEKHILTIYKWDKQGFTTTSGNPSTLSWKENGPMLAVRKEGHADSLLGHEKTHNYWYPWKRCNTKQCFLLPTSKEKFTLFIEWAWYVIIKSKDLYVPFFTLTNWKYKCLWLLTSNDNMTSRGLLFTESLALSLNKRQHFHMKKYLWEIIP